MRKSWVKILCNLDLLVAVVALIVLTLVTSGGVFMRYVVKQPILWQEEIQAFCQVWVVFLGGSVAFRMSGHVAIEMVVDALPDKWKKIFEYFVDLVVLMVLLFLCVKSQAYIQQVFGKSGRPTPILRIPYTYIYGIAPIGCVLMLISYFLGRYLPKFVKDTNIGNEFDALDGEINTDVKEDAP